MLTPGNLHCNLKKKREKKNKTKVFGCFGSKTKFLIKELVYLCGWADFWHCKLSSYRHIHFALKIFVFSFVKLKGQFNTFVVEEEKWLAKERKEKINT